MTMFDFKITDFEGTIKVGGIEVPILLTGAGTATTSSAVWSPTDVAGLKLWLKADAGLFQDTGGVTPASANNDPVGKWTDQSVGGNDVTQGTSTHKPLLKTAAQNSKPGVYFDGVDDELINTLTSLLAAGAARTLLVAGRGFAGYDTAKYFQFRLGGGFDWDAGFYFASLTYLYSDGISSNLWSTSDLRSTYQAPFQVNFKGAASAFPSMRLNGAAVTTVHDPTFNAETGTTGFRVGNSSGVYWKGHIFEVLVYDTALSGTDITAAETYLNSAARWGLY